MPSLYVHVPFCFQKCDYCAFYSLTRTDLIPNYLRGLASETELRSKESSAGVSSLFLGGGTPTALNARELESLLEIIRKNYVFKSEQREQIEEEDLPIIKKNLDQERQPQKRPAKYGTKTKILPKRLKEENTAEANPGTLTAEKLAVLSGYGINRISLGAQSFNDQLLKRIGRIHTADDIRSGVYLIRQSGISNLNLDLIFGLPGQTLADWQNTLKRAVELSPEHLSIYALTVEEDTPLGRKYFGSGRSNLYQEEVGARKYPGKKQDFEDAAGTEERNFYRGGYPVLPGDDLQADMYEWAGEYLREKGYGHYEISNFAKTGFECQHNLAYWQGKDYLGLGPGAVSCLEGIRTKNIADIMVYEENTLAGKKAFDPLETEILTREQVISEYMMLGLRTAEGVDFRTFVSKFQTGLEDIYGPILAKYINRGILIVSQGKLKIDEKFYFVANSVLEDFILDS